MATAASECEAGHAGLLCRQHQAAIVAQFPSWRIVPQPLRDRPAEAQKYIESVVAVARTFDERLHQPELLRSLMGDRSSSG